MRIELLPRSSYLPWTLKNKTCTYPPAIVVNKKKKESGQQSDRGSPRALLDSSGRKKTPHTAFSVPQPGWLAGSQVYSESLGLPQINGQILITLGITFPTCKNRPSLHANKQTNPPKTKNKRQDTTFYIVFAEPGGVAHASLEDWGWKIPNSRPYQAQAQATYQGQKLFGQVIDLLSQNKNENGQSV